VRESPDIVEKKIIIQSTPERTSVDTFSFPMANKIMERVVITNMSNELSE